MAPVVYQVAAIDYLLILVCRIFKGIGILDPARNGGQVHILALAVHYAALAEKQAEAGVPAQGQDGGLGPLPDSGVFPDFDGRIAPFFQGLRLLGAQIGIVDMLHKMSSQKWKN